jgi:hypothetical protein
MKSLLLIALAFGASLTAHATDLPITVCAAENNDLLVALQAGGNHVVRATSPAEAIRQAPASSAVLLLADEYPAHRLAVSAADFDAATQKHLSLFVEFPQAVPGVEFGKEQKTVWERAVIVSDAFGSTLPRGRILTINDCHYLACPGGEPLMSVARVAGFDTAVYGVPQNASPVLVEFPQRRLLVATTKLSDFVTGRYAPTADWTTVWSTILHKLAPDRPVPKLKWEPTVHPALTRDAPLPGDAERQTFTRAAHWFADARLLITPDRLTEIREAVPHDGLLYPPATQPANADGSLGILEGYASTILYDGNQLQRSAVRSDCNAESAMVLALDAKLNGSDRSRAIARNLLRFVYETSGLHGGVRGDPKHPAFGLIAWGAVSPAWERATYGDDDARVILATLLASASLDTADWDEHVLRSLLANLRTTGAQGFRGDRIDMPELEAKGWRAYHDAAPVNFSPHFESYLWACNLWAYRQTGERVFLDRTKNAIAQTMAAYAKRQWRWNDNGERSRMLLCLSWLIRLEDTPEHREWLHEVAHDLLAFQDPCGAIPDRLGGTGGGHYHIPLSNEAYGTSETPLIQTNSDKVSDQLYTNGFTLLGLHEAVAATGDDSLRTAEDRIADYLCRIQVRSTKVPYLDGTWFRAFDYGRWDYWASSADLGWGAWSAEAGWGQAWTAAALALRVQNTTYWDATAHSAIKRQWDKVQREMSENDGGPWKGKPWAGGETFDSH